MEMPLATKKHLEETMRLWQSTITELKKLEDFLSIDRINDQFYRRLFIRCVFSIIESYLYVTKELIKIKITIDSSDSISLSWEELVILNEKKVFLDNQGKVKTKEEYQRFDTSLKFTLNTFANIFGMGLPDYGDNKFQTLITLSTRRNDITHPKSLSQLVIKDQEMKDTVEVFRWFMDTHSRINEKFIRWLSELSERK
jgi:hypothetical protein